MKWKFATPLALAAVGVMSAVSFTVVANEPWLDSPPITVPGDPFDPPPTSEPTNPTRGGPQVNECPVIKLGSRPGDDQREWWQTFKCADGEVFTLVWRESDLTNILWNLPQPPVAIEEATS